MRYKKHISLDERVQISLFWQTNDEYQARIQWPSPPPPPHKASIIAKMN